MKAFLLPFITSYQLPIIALLVILLLLLILLGVKHGKKTYVQRKVALMGIDVLQNVKLTDAVGDDLDIDFLVLQPNKVIAVTVLAYDGLIFAAEQIDQWTQVVKNGSFKFTNPYQNFATQKNAVERAIKTANVECKVFFPNANFPKDRPDAILLMEDIPNKRQYKPAELREVSSIVADAWKILKGQV